MEKIHVVGLMVEKYIGTTCEGFNCDFEYVSEEMERYHLMLRCGNTRYKLSLENEYGECGSGWCPASWGRMTLMPVDHFGPFTHRPKNGNLVLDGCAIKYKNGIWTIEQESEHENYYFYSEEDIACNVFSYSEYGCDGYYPDGGVSVNMELFQPLKRAMHHRPVYIFKGNSGLGKSSLAMMCQGVEVFETDSVQDDVLPDNITASIVVLGNRHHFTVEQVKANLFGNPKVILVNFSEDVD
jgi:hypothetical protein